MVRAEENGKKPDDLHPDDEFDKASGRWKRSAERAARRKRQVEMLDPEKLLARIEAVERRLDLIQPQETKR